MNHIPADSKNINHRAPRHLTMLRDLRPHGNTGNYDIQNYSYSGRRYPSTKQSGNTFNLTPRSRDSLFCMIKINLISLYFALVINEQILLTCSLLLYR